MISILKHLPDDQQAQTLATIQQQAPYLLKTTQAQLIASAVGQYVTVHDKSKDTIKQASRLAYRDEPVLILGETGTGKELLSGILHAIRSISGKLVSINCSGLTGTLFESLVFGHKRGSFTGSISDEPGLLRAAWNGTAFFDEVGELPLDQQAKLLRTLQTGKVRPVGDTDEYVINCRFIFATHRDLQAMMERGEFRQDLYYRISKFVLRTVPLRDRPCDVIPICKVIYDRNKWTIPPIEELAPPVEAYAKGNVRQLENYLARLEVLNLTPEEALLDL